MFKALKTHGKAGVKRKMLTVITALAIGCLACVPTTALADSENTASADAQTGSSDYRIPVGSFIQTSLTWRWSDDQWQKELDAFKAAKMEYIIFNPSLMMSSDEIQTIYPSEIEEYKGKDIYTDREGNEMDTIDACLRNCEKAGVKVFIALNQDFEKTANDHFWQLGWKISTTKPDTFKAYWDKNAQICNQLADELFTRYKSKYPNAFYGWYWVHEFWNYSICTNAYEGKPAGDDTAEDPTVYTDILGEHALSPVLDHLSALDSSMPMIFSSFYNPSLSTSASMARMYGDVFKKTRFRPGDIWAPMDGLDGALGLDLLDEWTAAAKKATEANPNLHFWINNVISDSKSGANDYGVASIGRCVKQIEITSKYTEQNITFTWNHYYSPNSAAPGYNETYMQYVNTGSIEKNPPAAVDVSSINVDQYKQGDYFLSWTPAKDDVGIAAYNIYKNGNMLTRSHCYRGWTEDAMPFCEVFQPGEYEIEAEDFAGNVSPKAKFTVSDTPTTTTTTSKTTTTDSSTSVTDSTTITSKSADDTGITSTAVSTSVTQSPTTDADTVSGIRTSVTSDQNNVSSPKTGSAMPAAVSFVALAAAALGLAVKSKKIK